MSFEYFDQSIKLPFLNCNCVQHYPCEQHNYGKCICVRYYMHQVPKVLIRNPLDDPFFCDQCIWYLKNDEERSWIFQGLMDRALYQEFQKCSKTILANHMMQIAFNIHLLSKFRLSKKLKRIYNILKSKPEILIGKEIVQKFVVYCQERKHLQGLELIRRNLFVSEVIYEAKEIFEQYISKVFIDIKANPLLQFPLNPKQEKIFFSRQQNHFLVYYLQSQMIYVDIYEDTGKIIKSIPLPIMMMKNKIPNIQVILSEDQKYLVTLVNYYDCIVYELETNNFKNSELIENMEENKLFQTKGQIFMITNKKIWKLNFTKLEFEICLDFQIQNQQAKLLGGHFYKQKNLNLLFFQQKQDELQQNQIISITNSQCNQPIKHIGFKSLRVNEKIFPNSFLISEQNDLIFIIQKQNEHVVINQHSFACKKKLRSFKEQGEFKTNRMSIFLYQNSSKLAFVNNAIMRTYNLQTGQYIFTLVSNEMIPKFDQQFQIIDQNYLIKAGSQSIQAWQIINS